MQAFIYNYRNLKYREKVSSLRKESGVSTPFYMIHLKISSAKNKPKILLSLLGATSAGKILYAPFLRDKLKGKNLEQRGKKGQDQDSQVGGKAGVDGD